MQKIRKLTFKRMLRWFAVGLILGTAHQSQAIDSDDNDFSGARPNANQFRKLTDDFYWGAALGTNFYMERLHKETDRISFWRRFSAEEHKDHHNTYKRQYLDSRDEGKFQETPLPPGFLKFSGSDHDLSSGFHSLNESFGYAQDSELWICYTTPIQIQSPEDITAGDIEMVVSILTHSDAPFAVHMGINRSFQYQLNAFDEWQKSSKGGTESKTPSPKWPVHPALSVPLHAFAARVIQDVHANNKLYMISAPVPKVSELLTQQFPSNSWLGDSLSRARDQHDTQNPSESLSKIQKKRETLESEKELLQKNIKKLKQADNIENKQKIDKLKADEKALSNEIDSLGNSEWEIESQEISDISMSLPITRKNSPLQNFHKTLRILDPEREKIVYEEVWENSSQTITLNGHPYDTPKAFEFLRHPHISGTGCPKITITYDALANAWNEYAQPTKK